MPRIKVLRDYDAHGHGAGTAGEVKEISAEAFEYLSQYDTALPLVEETTEELAGPPAPEPVANPFEAPAEEPPAPEPNAVNPGPAGPQ